MLNELFKSLVHQDVTPIVICDVNCKIVYMNPKAIEIYHKDLTGQNLKKCHDGKSNELIDKVIEWFGKDEKNNMIHTFYNEKQNKDVYMIALRNDNNNLIGFYEKHEYRNVDTTEFYKFE